MSRWTYVSTVELRSFSGTTALTSPKASASAAVSRRPSSSISMAIAYGSCRSARCVPPLPGRIARLTSEISNTACSAAIRMSVANSSVIPPARQ